MYFFIIERNNFRGDSNGISAKKVTLVQVACRMTKSQPCSKNGTKESLRASLSRSHRLSSQSRMTRALTGTSWTLWSTKPDPRVLESGPSSRQRSSAPQPQRLQLLLTAGVQLGQSIQKIDCLILKTEALRTTSKHSINLNIATFTGVFLTRCRSQDGDVLSIWRACGGADNATFVSFVKHYITELQYSNFTTREYV